MALDGDATLTLQIHVIEHLPLSHLDGLGVFQQTVGQGRFTMVDMGYDAEISYVIHSIYLFRPQIYKKLLALPNELGIFSGCNKKIRYETSV